MVGRMNELNEKSVGLHGTAVALGDYAALLSGASGAGKSDLALRFINTRFGLFPNLPQPQLVGDDQVLVSVSRDCSGLMVRPAPSLAGLVEVRGLGIVHVPFVEEARLCLEVVLSDRAGIERMPPSELPVRELFGCGIPQLKLSPFDESAPHKLYLALAEFSGQAAVIDHDS